MRCREAAKDTRRQIFEIVASAWDEKPEDLEMMNGVVISKRSEREIPLKDFAVYGIPNEDFTGWEGGPIYGRGKFMPNYVTGLDPETGQGERAVVHYTTGAQAFEVEMDMEPERWRSCMPYPRLTAGGRSTRDLVRAQMEGGLIQGISSAVFEQMIFKDGHMLNPSFVDYRIATTMDLPKKMTSIIIEEPQDDGPWGARGIGEHPMVPTIAALGNAIYDAVGIRMEGPPFHRGEDLPAYQRKGERNRRSDRAGGSLEVKTKVIKGQYHDSVSLMLAAREMKKVEGVADAAVVMGTETNKGLLKQAGLLTQEARSGISR